MAVMKTGADRLIKDAVVLDLGDLGAQAARLRMQAEARAAEIVGVAEAKAAALIEAAHGQGFERGKAEGLEQGLAEGREQGRAEALAEKADELSQVVAAWSDVGAQWDGYRRDLEREAHETVLDFAIKLGERLVHRLVDLDRSVVVDQVATALSLVLEPLDVKVRVHPADRATLDEAMPDLMAEFAQFEHVRLVEDGDVGRGGCVVAYGQGEVDATIDTQLRRVLDVILPGQVDAARRSAEAAGDRDAEGQSESGGGVSDPVGGR
jgi:flagellar biosynthesis/type III secretory pathway protein FliH